MILCLGLAAFSARIGLAAIIGAFLAGMVVAESQDRHDSEEEVAPLYAFLRPLFFAFIGLTVELAAFADAATLAELAGITALAVATKLGAGWLAAPPDGIARRPHRRPGHGPAGEIGIIVAGIGAATGAITSDQLAVIVGMSIAITLLVPPLLSGSFARAR